MSERDGRRCLACGADISHKRRQARYCDDTCSKRYRRGRWPIERIEPKVRPPRLEQPTRDDLADLIIRLIAIEAALRFAAKRCDIRLRPMCVRLAESIRQALEREGLRDG